jgi:chromosome segregation and condensation protein ScpB
VTRNELGRIVGGTPRAVENALAELAAAYEATGLRLARSGDEWQIVTAPQHAPQVAAYLGADRLRLSPASLETLSVVAYRQPVTRAEVEAIRPSTRSPRGASSKNGVAKRPPVAPFCTGQHGSSSNASACKASTTSRAP